MNASRSAYPDERGRFGDYGGQFVPETLMSAVHSLEEAYRASKEDPAFQRELAGLLADYAGRPTPLYYATQLTAHAGGARIYLKREDLAHTGAHKINNVLGQALLVKRMGKPRVVAETGAGQHGVAAATACAMMGLECVVYMGTEDMKRQAPNVYRMRILGAEVRPVDSGSRTLKDAINEAIRDWVTNVETTHYLLGSVVGPHPYPMMVRDFQSVIGREAREQMLEHTGRLPDYAVACVGGGSNAMGLFTALLQDEDVRLVGVEFLHAECRLAEGKVIILRGTAGGPLAAEQGRAACRMVFSHLPPHRLNQSDRRAPPTRFPHSKNVQQSRFRIGISVAERQTIQPDRVGVRRAWTASSPM